MKYDAIIVGSGIGGLTVAAILAREGRRVLVLEQHTRFGGASQCFTRKGELLPTGVHYLGALAPGQVLWRYFDYLGLTGRVPFVELDPDGFDEYRFPGLSFRIPRGQEAFRQRLLEHFPSEGPAIDRFVDDMRRCCARFALYNLEPPVDVEGSAYDHQPLAAYLDALGVSPELRAVLIASGILYGVPAEDCPIFAHFLVLDSYLQSAWRVEGGSQKLVDALVEVIRELGGELRKGAPVVRIDCEGGRVRGLELKRGERFEADCVVFSGHIKKLFPLVPEDALRPAYVERLATTRESISFFGAHLVQREVAAPVPDRNYYLFDSWDAGLAFSARLVEPGRMPHVVYCARNRNPATGAVQTNLLAPMSYEEMSPWHGTRLGWRDDSYKAMKADAGARLIEYTRRYLPEAVEGAELLSTFTPLTIRDFLGAPEGSAYGIMKSVSQLRAARVGPRTRVAGLFLAGQNLVMPGVVGTVIGSVAACCNILGTDYLVSRIRLGGRLS